MEKCKIQGYLVGSFVYTSSSVWILSFLSIVEKVKALILGYSPSIRSSKKVRTDVLNLDWTRFVCLRPNRKLCSVL